jgi:hypothetical protein
VTEQEVAAVAADLTSQRTALRKATAKLQRDTKAALERMVAADYSTNAASLALGLSHSRGWQILSGS